MADEKKEPGTINWVDLTVEDAGPVRDFYRDVIGWSATEFDMGGYEDYCMNTPREGKTIAGICHARGGNAGLPPQWLIYINVENLDKSIERCVALGGSILAGPKSMGKQGRYCVIRDPAGAAAALFEPGE